MRILLDESLPKDIAPLIAGHELTTVRAAGWSGVKNGKLLALAATKFDLFLTADRNLEHQQNLAALPIAVVVLRQLRREVNVSGQSSAVLEDFLGRRLLAVSRIQTEPLLGETAP